MKNNFFIKSSRNNCYHFAMSTGLFSLISPVLFDVANLYEQGYEFRELLKKLLPKYEQADIERYFKIYKVNSNNHPLQDVSCAKLLSKKMVENAIKNLQQLTIEVTNSCNLKCKYCGYGELYDNYDPRNGQKLSINKVRALIDYLSPYWNEYAHNQPMFVSFYGGEPLLNFELIKEVVDIFERLNCSRKFIFSMTTNGTMLHHYIDYLVQHNFKLLISLDGNELSNSYRIKKNGEPSFIDVVKNIMWIKRNFKDFYSNNINFNSVLHNRSNVCDVIKFFQENFEKRPQISSLNTSGIKEDRKDEFNRIYNDIQENIKQTVFCKHTESILQVEPLTREFNLFTHQLNQFVYSDFNSCFRKNRETEKVPSGTCIPFSRKMYLAVSGKIFPCEKIGQEFKMGKIVGDTVEIDFDEIVDKYNRVYQKIGKTCNACYRKRMCSQCIFHMHMSNKQIMCNGYLDEKSFVSYLKEMIDRMEIYPSAYKKSMKDVIIR